MEFAAIKEKAQDLFREAAFICHIQSNEEYEQALALMNEVIEDYDNQRLLIEMLSAAIERWEDTSPEFAEFNQRIREMSSDVTALKVIMEQHGLGVADLPEIGSKSLVSKILNNERNLTRNHIAALCKRFGVSPVCFFPLICKEQKQK